MAQFVSTVMVAVIAGSLAAIITRYFTMFAPGIRTRSERVDALPNFANAAACVVLAFYPEWTIYSWFLVAFAASSLWVAELRLTRWVGQEF